MQISKTSSYTMLNGPELALVSCLRSSHAALLIRAGRNRHNKLRKNLCLSLLCGIWSLTSWASSSGTMHRICQNNYTSYIEHVWCSTQLDARLQYIPLSRAIVGYPSGNLRHIERVEVRPLPASVVVLTGNISANFKPAKRLSAALKRSAPIVLPRNTM